MEAPAASEVVSPVDKGEPAVLRKGLGTYPGPEAATGDRERVGGSRKAKEEEEEPDAVEPPASCQLDAAKAEDINVELRLCQVLTSWNPFGAPSAEVVDAMAEVQTVRATTCVKQANLASMGAQRAEAILALAYEQAAGESLPASLRGHRLARIW